MKLYKARIRLAGSLLNEVWKYDVTASQLLVLTRIHQGGDNFPLAEVVETGSVQRTDKRERARLHQEYLEWGLGTGDKLLTEVLGHVSTPLPQFYAAPETMYVEEFDDTLAEKAEADAEVIETVPERTVIAPERRRVAKGSVNPAHVSKE